MNLFGGCARDSTFSVPTARVHYDQVTLTGTYHHAPRYLARALEILAENAWPWPELCGPVIELDSLPDALAGPPARAAAREVHGAAGSNFNCAVRRGCELPRRLARPGVRS